MNARMVVCLSLGIGLTFSLGCAYGGDEASVPLAAAPTPLVPAAYNLLPAVVAPTAASQTRTSSLPRPTAAPDPGIKVRSTPNTSVTPDQYHPHWVVDVH